MATTSGSGRIQGLTIQIGGDTTKLDKALQSTNKEIRNTQTALKDVEKLLKLDPTNLELLEQKQKLLGNTVEETSKKLETLYEAEKQLKEAGIDENSEQFMGLRREIIDTEGKLKDAKKAANQFSAELTQAANAMSKVSDGAKKVADKTKGLSTAAAGVAAGLAGIAYNAVTASDDLNTLAQQSGLTTEEIQKFQYASDLVDVSTDDIISSLKKMRKNMDSTSTDVQEAWDALGVSVKDSQGNFRDSITVFYETLEALSKVENETQRDIYAMQLFGKNADSLAGIIDDGGQSLKEIGDEAERLGLVLDQQTLDSLNAINDQIDTIKYTAQGLLATTGAKAMEALTPVFEKIMEALSRLFEWIGSLSTENIELVLTITAIVAAISPVANIISQITGAVSSLLLFWPKIATAFSAVMSFVAANPITLIAAAVAALAVIIVKNWDKIKVVLDNIKKKTTELLDVLKERIKGNINIILGFVNKAINAINKLINGVNKVGGAVGIKAQIPTISTIPMLASGGTISSGSAIVGEAGAELLTMNNGRATVTPLTSNDGITDMLGTISGQLGSTNPVQLTVYSVLDGRIVGRSTANYNMQKQMMYGG